MKLAFFTKNDPGGTKRQKQRPRALGVGAARLPGAAGAGENSVPPQAGTGRDNAPQENFLQFIPLNMAAVRRKYPD